MLIAYCLGLYKFIENKLFYMSAKLIIKICVILVTEVFNILVQRETVIKKKVITYLLILYLFKKKNHLQI